MHPVPQPADFDAATPGAREISFLAGVLVITAFGAIGLTASLLFGAYGLVAFVIAHAVVSRMVSANLVWQSGVSGRTAGVFWLFAAVLAWPLSNIAVMVSPSELSALIHLGGADGTTDARSLPSVWHLLGREPRLPDRTDLEPSKSYPRAFANTGLHNCSHSSSDHDLSHGSV